MKKLLLILLSGCVISTSFAATTTATSTASTAASSIKLGTDYTVMTPPTTATPAPKGQVNVKEFFSFACIHCKLVDPLVEQQLVSNKKINLERIQVNWTNTDAYAKIAATIQTLQNDKQLGAKAQKLYPAIFNAVFARQNVADPKVLSRILAQNGFSKTDIDKFMNTYNSFDVGAKVGRYKQLTNLYNISGTPTFIVADKYVVSPAQPQRLIDVTKYLVNKALAK
jgi:thiol:disulfide interchange protein DsbA